MTARLEVVVLAVGAAVLQASVAFAHHDEGSGHGERSRNAVFEGTVASVSQSELVVGVLSASRWGRGAEGRRVGFVAGDESRIQVPDRDGDGEAELSDLQPGDEIQVVARIATGGAGCDPPGCEPEKLSRVKVKFPSPGG